MIIKHALLSHIKYHVYLSQSLVYPARDYASQRSHKQSGFLPWHESGSTVAPPQSHRPFPIGCAVVTCHSVGFSLLYSSVGDRLVFPRQIILTTHTFSLVKCQNPTVPWCQRLLCSQSLLLLSSVSLWKKTTTSPPPLTCHPSCWVHFTWLHLWGSKC